MLCPSCSFELDDLPWNYVKIKEDDSSVWFIYNVQCPSCSDEIIRLIIFAKQHFKVKGKFEDKWNPMKDVILYPKESIHRKLPNWIGVVPDKFAMDYKEANFILYDSPKASCTLSRRCIQNILTTMENVYSNELSVQIKEIAEKPNFPSSLIELLDVARKIGNLSAHPEKTRYTKEVVQIEPAEAEFCLDVLEELFKYYFVK